MNSLSAFCVLEKDKKTYEYLSRFFSYKLSGRQLFQLENAIQVEEISSHLKLNSCLLTDQKEKIHWVVSHGANFRAYLETIKYAMEELCKTEICGSPSELSWDHFCMLVDKVNEELEKNKNCSGRFSNN